MTDTGRLSDFLPILGIAAAAAVASPLGGLIALWRKPTTLFMSIVLGFAGGTLLGAVSFEIMPKSLELTSIAGAALGFVLGFLAVYGFDLLVHRFRLAGLKAEQHRKVRSYYARHRPFGDEITVLAGGTSSEEIIEGLSIGVGTSLEPNLGLLIALAIFIDNAAEGLSIGELIMAEKGAKRQLLRRVLTWTGLIGVSLFLSALAGWFLLRDLSPSVLGFLFASGGGAIFYLTVTDLVPEAEERHYQQSAGIATGAGFMLILVLAQSL